jgi:hypothetical protein
MNVCMDLHPIGAIMRDGTTYLDKEMIEELCELTLSHIEVLCLIYDPYVLWTSIAG